MNSHNHMNPLEVNQHRSHARLGTKAVYRVCGFTDSLVEVEVVRSPGLERGQRFRFDAAAVRKMPIATV
jgi:hypothetical protein